MICISGARYAPVLGAPVHAATRLDVKVAQLRACVCFDKLNKFGPTLSLSLSFSRTTADPSFTFQAGKSGAFHLPAVNFFSLRVVLSSSWYFLSRASYHYRARLVLARLASPRLARILLAPIRPGCYCYCYCARAPKERL